MFGFFKEKITKIYNQFTTKAASIFAREKLDQEFLDELYKLLISSDVGVKTANEIINNLKEGIGSKKINSLEDAKQALQNHLISMLRKFPAYELEPQVTLLVGINGSGKTSFIAKYAKQLKDKNKKVLVVAADTFRAAAVEQLNNWVQKIDVDIFIGKENQDPASVVFDACKKFKQECYDHIIIDTAGRLQTKVNLLKELEKIKKVISKVLPDIDVATWLSIDAMLGQNALQQATIFDQTAKLDGIVLTKLDGTGKGGIVFAITCNLKLPILYVTFGETLNDIKAFDPKEYVQELFE